MILRLFSPTFLEKDLELVKSQIFALKDRTVLCNRLCLSELYYVLCRRRGEAFTRESTNTFLKGQYASVIASDELDMATGAFKCKRMISLADCYVLGLAELEGAAALFGRKERELAKEVKKKPFAFPVQFLEDYVD